MYFLILSLLKKSSACAYNARVRIGANINVNDRRSLVMMIAMSLFAGSALFGNAAVDSTPFFVRLKFDLTAPMEADSAEYQKYLWERKLLPDSAVWTTADNVRLSVENPPRKIKVGLVLAGGGDRGIAHIGVLRALEENNIPIDAIAGTSMGAIVGGFYACGYSIDALEDIVLDSIQWRTIFSDQAPLQYLPVWERLRDKPREPGINWDITWNLRPWPPQKWFPSALVLKPGAGLRTAQKFTDEIAQRTLTADYLSGFQFDRLPIPFGAMLTNMTTRKPQLKLSGTVSTAARASGSLPLVFEPMKIEGVEYVDGMVMDNLPVDAFRRFDKHRAPDTLMRIEGDTIDFIIAVDPIRRRGLRDELEIKPELSGSMGIGVMNQTSTMARDFYVWENWDAADARIDVDVEGAFDFSPSKLRDKIRKGYDAAWMEMYWIKKKLVEKELLIDPVHSRAIHRVASIRLRYLQDGDTVDVKDLGEHKRIFRAIRAHEGSYVENGDLCDILRRVYFLGDFNDVVLKVEAVNNDWALNFFMRKKAARQNARDSVKCRLCGEIADDKTAESAVDRAVSTLFNKKSRILDFSETKRIVEKTLVEQGYLAPRIESVEYNPAAKLLNIYVWRQGRLKQVITYDAGSDSTQKQTFFTRRVDGFIKDNASPYGAADVLKTGNRAYRRFNLKTMAIEKSSDSILMIGIEKKPGNMIEGPAISLEKQEGISLFGETRCREWTPPFWREWLCWSTYLNYTQNFPLKLAEQLAQGQKVDLGMQRCNYKFIVPEWSAYWRTLRYSLGTGPVAYDTQFEEYNIRLALPFYLPASDLFAFVPCVQGQKTSTHPLQEEGVWQDWRFIAGSQMRLAHLDRIIFPESGFMVDIEASFAEELGELWQRARAKAVCVPVRHRIQGAAMSVLTLRGYMSYYAEGTPPELRYSMGGLTPAGSYQLRRFDAEDLPGYDLDEFVEPWMWKIGGSYRIALVEMNPLDLRLNLYLVASYDLGSAAPSFRNSFLSSNLKHCPTGGFQLDMTYFNIGLIYIGKQDKLLDNFHLSVVFYGLGL